MLLRTDNNTRHNICIVPRQSFVLATLRPHQYMSPDYYYYNLGLGELTALITIITTALTALHIWLYMGNPTTMHTILQGTAWTLILIWDLSRTWYFLLYPATNQVYCNYICEKLASRNFAKQRETSRKVAKLREKSRNFAFFREVFFGHFAKFLSPFREVSRCFAKLFSSFREASRRFIGRFSRKLKYCFAKTRETSRTSKIFAK